MIGVFQAKIKDYGVSTSKAGLAQVFVTFDFEHEGAQKNKPWFGSFAGGAKDITLKSLIACGLKPQHYGQLINLKQGIASNMLDLNKVLSIDIQEEPDYNDPSKIKSKIQWVNDPMLAPAVKKIDDATNAQFFGSNNFEGDLMRLAGEMGISNNNGMANQNMNQNMNQNQNMNVNPNQNFNQNANQNFNQNQNTNQNMNQNAGQQNNAQGFSAPF